VLVDIFENQHFERSGAKFGVAAALRWRLVMWAGAVLVAALAHRSLQYVTALIGINSVIISVLLPLFFSVNLHWQGMGPLRQLWFGTLVLLSMLMALVIACVDVQEFVRSLGA